MHIGMQVQNSVFLTTAQYLLSIGVAPVLLQGKKPIFTTFTSYLPGAAGSDELQMPLDKRPLRYTPDLLREWDREYPGANVGMLTDNRPCIDVDMWEIWPAIADLVPVTPHIKYGAKGRTFVYSVHPTDPVRRTRTYVNRFDQQMILEVLAHGRQTVLPPSIHPETGRAYEWVGMPEWGYMVGVPLGPDAPPPLSQATVDAIERRLEELGVTKKKVETGQELVRQLRDDERHRYEAFLAPKLKEKLASVREAAKGTRRDALNGAAFSLAPWVREGFIDENWLEAELRKACELNGFISEDGDKAFTYQFHRSMRHAEDKALPDLDAGRAAQLMGQAPLSATFPAAGGSVSSEVPWVRVSEMLTNPVPAREWLVPEVVPHKQITLLYGDGGTGKTTLLLQLAIAASQGGMWMGHALSRHKVLFITAEDELNEVHYRLDQMTKLLGRDVGDLTVISLADLEIAELMMLDGRVLKPTTLLEGICDLIKQQGFDVVMMDPIADLFGGNEIDKQQVTKFMRMLRKRIAFDLGCSLVIAAHPSSDGIRSGKGTSGSMAWSNSARSRLYFSRDDNSDVCTLELKKSNRSKIGTTVSLRWVNGVFVQVEAQARALISEELEAKVMARLDREGPIYKAGDRSQQWVGYMLELELGEKLATSEGKRKVRTLLDSWEKLGYVKKLRRADKHGNMQEFVNFISHPTVVQTTVATTVP